MPYLINVLDDTSHKWTPPQSPAVSNKVDLEENWQTRTEEFPGWTKLVSLSPFFKCKPI